MPSIRTTKQPRTVKAVRAPRTAVKQRTVQATPRPAIKHRLLPSIQSQIAADMERRAVPVTQVYGTILERIVYKSLQQLHIPFSFQSSVLGGRTEWGFGRQVADFYIYSLNLVIEVEGTYWHTSRDQAAKDSARELALAAQGKKMVTLWEDVIRDPMLLERWLQDHVMHGGTLVTGFTLSSPLPYS